MLQTEIIHCVPKNKREDCLNDLLEATNSFIKKNYIKRQDIIEYRTKEWATGILHHAEAILTWWK